jgi:NAD(P)-dependent dehydrogenase (short-subunit alcohol dehydrogenase family)
MSMLGPLRLEVCLISLTLKGKLAIITGANQGFGLVISHKYVNAGASIVMCARNGDLLTRRGQKEQIAGQGGISWKK